MPSKKQQTHQKELNLNKNILLSTAPETKAFEYIDGLIGGSRNFTELHALLQVFLSVHTEDSRCWFSWLHAEEAIELVNRRDNCTISRAAFFRMVKKLKEVGLLREVLPYTWKNNFTVEGQCAVYMVDPVLVAIIEETETTMEPSTKSEAIELAKRSARRTKSNPDKVLSEYSLHDRAEVEEMKHFEREAELAAEEAQEYSEYCYAMDYQTWLNESAEGESVENEETVDMASSCTSSIFIRSVAQVVFKNSKIALNLQSTPLPIPVQPPECEQDMPRLAG
jgi:hypothetical protein